MHETDLGRALGDVARRQGPRGFTFDDLARPARHQRATIGQVADWLARARTRGNVLDMGFDAGLRGLPDGPRRYRLRTAADAAQDSGAACRSTDRGAA
jgi:hypothetical protein